MTYYSGYPTAEQYDGAATFSALHLDVIESHILTRLDGASLASAAASCSQLQALCSSGDHLWSSACRSTWPSMDSLRVRDVITAFPNGPRSFFSDAFTTSTATISNSSDGFPKNTDNVTTKLISAVDIFHGQDLILSKETVKTHAKYGDDTCWNLIGELRLSWILIDPAAKRALNVASRRPVSLRWHWLTGEVGARFATAVSGGERETAEEEALFSAVVIWRVAAEGGEMQMREVSLHAENLDGMHFNGRDSLVILIRSLRGKRVKVRIEDEEERYIKSL